MSDHWSSRVTVTLGRSDRVMKRAGVVSEDGFSNGMSMLGRKRSINNRLGGDSDERNQHYNKRQHGESHGTSSLNDMHLDKDDLRLKLMQKNTVRRLQKNDSLGDVDLRYKLSSRTSQPSVDSKLMHQPEATFSTRHTVPEPRDAGIARHPMFEPRDISTVGRIPSSRNTSHLSTLGPGRTYPSWALDNVRRRSPESILPSATAGGLSHESREELSRSLIRAYGDERSSSCLRVNPSRPASSSTFLTRSSVPVAPVSSVRTVPVHYPQGSGIIQKIPSMVDEHPTVESLLRRLGLEKYAIYFKAEEIDMNAFRQLGDHDLKELGIPMGPRKKILQALMSRFRRYPREKIAYARSTIYEE